MSKVRVLVVDDSLTVRKRLREILESDPDFEVVADAADGKEAIEMCRLHRPDAMTMDMIMPVMTGLAATEYIMAHFPTPILIVSASINRGEVFKTYDALAAGALDVLDKPSGDEMDGEWERHYRATVKLIARIRVITHPRGRLGYGAVTNHPPDAPLTSPAASSENFRMVAIGASTGGPGAIVEVLRGLPPTFDLPILFVLHIGAPFATSFAEWLDGQTSRSVRYAVAGERVEDARGYVLMGPPNHHLVVRGGRVVLSDAPERHSCKPSVDVLFESVAQDVGAKAVACLLTGMGKDGAAGLKAIRDVGGYTIAQDEASCVIYGMPREAVMRGAAKKIAPLSRIGAMLGELAHHGSTAEGSKGAP